MTTSTLDHNKLAKKIWEDRQRIVSQNSIFLKDKLMMEFGVHSGGSLRQFRKLYNMFVPQASNSLLYGFDSFEGLPNETKDKNNPDYWSSGQFDLSGNIPSDLTEENGYKIYKGWFEKTLTKELADSLEGKQLGLLHVDCDIYSSAYTVLDFCFANNLVVPGTIIVYDDWGAYKDIPNVQTEYEMGEGLAHAEILTKYGKTATLKEKNLMTSPPEHHQHYEVAVFVID